MSVNFEIYPAFPSLIYKSNEFYNFKPDEYNFFNSLNFVEQDPVSFSEDCNILGNDEMKCLKNFIFKHIKNYISNVLELSDQIEFYITESWVNKMGIGGSHQVHRHPNSIFSGIFYIFGENSPIHFIDERGRPFSNFKLDAKNYNYVNSASLSFENIPGSLFLFPSDLSHFVPPNEKDGKRMSLSFNTFFKGTICTHQTSSLILE